MSARSMRENGFSSPNGPPSCVQSRRGDPNLQTRAAILRGMGQKMWCNIKASLCGPDALLPGKPGQASVRLSQRLAPHTKSGERCGEPFQSIPPGRRFGIPSSMRNRRVPSLRMRAFSPGGNPSQASSSLAAQRSSWRVSGQRRIGRIWFNQSRFMGEENRCSAGSAATRLETGRRCVREFWEPLARRARLRTWGLPVRVGLGQARRAWLRPSSVQQVRKVCPAKLQPVAWSRISERGKGSD